MLQTQSRTWLLLPGLTAIALLVLLVEVWQVRLFYPYDLEWMEGGMLAHAWRLNQDLPLYAAPTAEWVPYIYPPGYSSLVSVVSEWFGMTLPTGRVISLGATLVSSVILAVVVHRQTGQREVAILSGVVFLGAFEGSGAFYDLVRPDSLALVLLAGSVALSLERFRGAVEVAGLLLAASYLVKHSGAAFGLPLAIGIAARDGWRSGLRFALWAAIPAGVVTGWLQVQTDGHFLRYLVEVPGSHPSVWSRVIPGMPRELGNALPVALLVPAIWLVFARVGASHSKPVLVVVPVLCGVAFGTVIRLQGPLAEGLHALPAGLGAWSLGAAGGAVVLSAAQAGWSRDQEGASAAWVMAVGLGVVALATAAVMRAHDGGYLNVYMPAHWIICLGFGVVAGHLWSEPRWRPLVAVALAVQLGFSAGSLDTERLVPSERDREVAEVFVNTLANETGPVLSPAAAWLPAQAGHAPSVHLIALWDLNHETGPYPNFIEGFIEAMGSHHWGAVVHNSQPIGFDAEKHYLPRATLNPGGRAMRPASGWEARPIGISRPKGRE